MAHKTLDKFLKTFDGKNRRYLVQVGVTRDLGNYLRGLGFNVSMRIIGSAYEATINQNPNTDMLPSVLDWPVETSTPKRQWIRPTKHSAHNGIEEAAHRSQFVIVDLEGTASLMVANTIGMADLVLIPTQGASMDARGAAKTIRLIRNQARLARREIAHRVLLTRTSAAVTSRALKNVRDQLDRSGIPVLNAAIVERAAYRDILDYGGLLSQLDPKQVSNLDKAIDNAAYVAEVLELLRATRNPVGKAA